jgi:hypothetical protein
LFSQATCPGNGLELAVDVLGIALLASPDRAHSHDAMFRIKAVNDAMVSEWMLPISGERTAKRQPIPLRVNGQLFLQGFSELIPHASIESFNVRRSVRRVSKFKRKFGGRLF